MSAIDLSLVIPVYNEIESLPRLVKEIHAALDPTDYSYEVLLIDDGSTDGSTELLQTLTAADTKLIAISFRRNYGQTAAFAAGFDYARGRYVCTLDADLQNPPADIPNLIAKLEEGYDVVNGWRQNRQDGFLLRKLPSKIANNLIARSTGVRLRDRGCSLRAFRSEVVKEIKLYGEMHRFIPETVSNAGFSMTEVPVSHRSREAGVSKYGLSRTFRVIVDLIAVLFLRNYADRPMHLFGGVSLVSGGLGGFLALWLSLQKIIAGIRDGMAGFQAYQIGDRPLLLLAVLLIIVAVQFLAMGLLAELLVRTYYESQHKAVYQVKARFGGPDN
ncbi:MAG: glycosyltransferase family 2 protein [Candidatus Promineifilaceae bacterium]